MFSYYLPTNILLVITCKCHAKRISYCLHSHLAISVGAEPATSSVLSILKFTKLLVKYTILPNDRFCNSLLTWCGKYTEGAPS